jgi:hypothetical protein
MSSIWWSQAEAVAVEQHREEVRAVVEVQVVIARVL